MVDKGTIIPGEGADRLFVVDGNSWRARVAVISAAQPQAPVNGKPSLAPSGYGLAISVALLDPEGAVATDAFGDLLVFDATVLTIDAQSLAAPGYDVETKILDMIHDRIAQAAPQLEKRRLLNAALQAWLPAVTEVDGAVAAETAISPSAAFLADLPPAAPPIASP